MTAVARRDKLSWWQRGLGGTLGACVVGVVAPDAQVPTFSTRVDAVRVDVLVSERGRPLQGLGPGDFEVLDNGVPQTIDQVDLGQLPVNVILVLDTSDSVTGRVLQDLLAAGDVVFDALRPGDQVAVVGFSHLVTVGTGLTGDLAKARAALHGPEHSGQTSLVDASLTALLLSASDAGRGLVMLFSDGVDTASWLRPDEVLDAAKRGQAVVYAVATERSGRASFLRDLTRETGGALFSVGSTEELAGRFLAIIEEFRQRYVLSYRPNGVSAEGWHQLTVRVRGRRATVQARPGYLAGRP